MAGRALVDPGASYRPGTLSRPGDFWGGGGWAIGDGHGLLQSPVAPRGSPSGHEVPAVDVDRGARDVGGVLRGEEDERGADLGRLPGPPHRGVGAELRDLLGLERGRDQRGPDGAGRDGVDADAVLGEVLGERAGEPDDGPLRRGVVEEATGAGEGGDGGDVDDGVALAEVVEGGLGEEDVAEDVGLERPPELLLGDL